MVEFSGLFSDEVEEFKNKAKVRTPTSDAFCTSHLIHYFPRHARFYLLRSLSLLRGGIGRNQMCKISTVAAFASEVIRQSRPVSQILLFFRCVVRGRDLEVLHQGRPN